MQTTAINMQNPTTFSAKQRFLNKQQLSDMRTILQKMNKETVTERKEYTFSSNILAKVKSGKSSLYDGRLLLGPTKKLEGTATLELGKTSMDVDIKTGEILKSDKPFYKTWKNVMKNVSEFFKTVNENFSNNEQVQKMFIGVKGFTQKGAEIIDRARTKANHALPDKKL
ncbi:hypothetical protein IKJ53_00840 [bacterium]|nr:hypothetical protein [bacterium]